MREAGAGVGEGTPKGTYRRRARELVLLLSPLHAACAHLGRHTCEVPACVDCCERVADATDLQWGAEMRGARALGQMGMAMVAMPTEWTRRRRMAAKSASKMKR